MTFDLLEFLSVVTALGALAWGFIEHKSRVRAELASAQAASGDYVESLASAAHELVDTYRKDVAELRSRIEELEKKLDLFGCSDLKCPVRISLKRRDSN